MTASLSSLYKDRPYLQAYAAHTDMRVADDPHAAIGLSGEWDIHGAAQLRFLVANGLQPGDRLLDLGCGTGRAARKLVPYLNVAHYTGADMSPAALHEAIRLSQAEGWDRRAPDFVHIPGGRFMLDSEFEYVWAHSVLTHLPEREIRDVVASVKEHLAPKGMFLFTYLRSKQKKRTGVKSFRYPFSLFEKIASENGMVAMELSRGPAAAAASATVLWGATGSMG